MTFAPIRQGVPIGVSLARGRDIHMPTEDPSRLHKEIPMTQSRWSILVAVVGLSLLAPLPGRAETTPVERGREAVRGKPSLNPPLATLDAYANVWKQWGLKKKPADFLRALEERYGLHQAPYDNGELPMGLHPGEHLFLGKGVSTDCLLCHAGRIAGQTVIGLGNASLDLQGLFQELTAANPGPQRVPFVLGNVRGTIDPVTPIAFLMNFRDPELNLRQPPPFKPNQHVCSDPPAWWLLKKKKTRNWTGNVAAQSARVDIATLLHPLNSPAFLKHQEPVFKDIHAFVLSVKPPRYPFPIDGKRAAVGKKVFEHRCSRCHGTYGPDGTYPNKIVPLAAIGTDPLLAKSLSEKLVDDFNKSWFAREKGPDGKPYTFTRNLGYQAPPLDGVWATAPYLHNGSVPTVYHMLKSEARPRIFTRSYHTEKEDYDPTHLGWKFTVLDRGPDPKAPGVQRRRVYDTTVPGQSNAGHLFGDKLSEEERLAVIEYLKTL
jgi:mono/diheme cytochrome c family protein